MKSEKQRLIDDLLEDGSCRESTLLAGTQVLRRRRHRRTIRQMTILAFILVAAFLWREQKSSRQPAPSTAVQATKPSRSNQAQSLTEDELLALFPKDVPVGLATLSDGKQLLIFPRPADEKKYVIRL